MGEAGVKIFTDGAGGREEGEKEVMREREEREREKVREKTDL